MLAAGPAVALAETEHDEAMPLHEEGVVLSSSDGFGFARVRFRNIL